MSWQAFGRAPWAAPSIPNTVPPGQQLPPPVPGGTTSYRYATQAGAAPWAMRSWAGGSRIPAWPGGGIVLVPNISRGTVDITVWWPDATALLLLRVTPDGVRTPVRGGYPVRPTAPTRRNQATNPGFEAGLNGYAPSDGTPTLSTIAGSVGLNALRATVAGAGSNGVTVPHALTVSATATIGLDLAFSARPTAVSISVGYTNSTGGALTASTSTLTANQVNNSVGQWSRQVVTAVAPAGAATVGTIKVLATGMPAGGQMDIDAVTIERDATSGSAYDGDSLGAMWTGTRHLSASMLAPLLTLSDGESPFDTGVYYEAYNPAVTGGRITSQQVSLSSLDRTWLTHPVDPGNPIVVQPSAPTGARTYDVDQGVFYPVGRSKPVVVSAAERRAATGTVAFGAMDRAEQAALRAAFADLSPVLLRTPAGYDPGDTWLALGALTIDPQGRLPSQDTRILSAPYHEVDPPDPALTG